MSEEEVEEYLEAILDLTADGGQARVTVLATRLGVAPASVTEAVKRLALKGYIDYVPYKGVSLTEKGRGLAVKIKRKHRLIERFLVDILGFRKDEVHDDACALEHSISDRVEDRMCNMLGAPESCPSGSPIPPCGKKGAGCTGCTANPDRKAGPIGDESVEDGADTQGEAIPLPELGTRKSGKIVLVKGQKKIVSRLRGMGILRGTVIRMVRKAPLGGPVEIESRGSCLALDREVARNILVRPRKRR